MKTVQIDLAIQKYENLIRSSDLFHQMTGEEFEKALEILCTECSLYSKGEYLHQAYARMNRFGMVLSGVVQACMDDMEGNRMIMAEVVPGITFGESLCFLEVGDSPVYVYASEPSEVLWFSTKNFFHDSPDAFTVRLQKRFTMMLASRTMSMNDRIQVLSKIRLRDKVTTYFSQISQRNRSLTFQIPMNRDDLATYMGTNRSALSRELSQMKSEGLIDYYRNTIRILK